MFMEFEIDGASIRGRTMSPQRILFALLLSITSPLVGASQPTKGAG